MIEMPTFFILVGIATVGMVIGIFIVSETWP
jgi:hypothetical protein